jgi:hypothetical protein
LSLYWTDDAAQEDWNSGISTAEGEKGKVHSGGESMPNNQTDIDNSLDLLVMIN